MRGEHDREILRLAIPAFGALIAEPLYVLTDTAIVGHIGTDELGGVAVATAVLLTIHAMMIFLAYGTTATVARRLGAGDDAGAAHHGVQALWVATGFGLLLAAVGAVMAPTLVDWFGADAAVRPHALTYFRISLLGLPSLLLVLAGTGYLRGLQDTRTPLVVAVATAVGNAVVEIVLVYGLDFGVAGSAWSTVLAQAAGALVYLRVVLRAAHRHGVRARPNARVMRAYSRIGGQLFVRTMALRSAFLLSAVAAARIGTADLAAHVIVIELWAFISLALDSLAIAGQALIGRWLGSGDPVGARRASARIVQWSVGLGVIFGVALVVFHRALPHVFTNDAEVVALTSFLILLAAAQQPLNGLVFALDGVLIGAGDLAYLAWAMLAAAVAFLPAILAVVILEVGIGWVWAALAWLMAARGIGVWWRYRSDAWLVTGPAASS